MSGESLVCGESRTGVVEKKRVRGKGKKSKRSKSQKRAGRLA